VARIRSIKPDTFTSETLAQVPIEARWTFAGLWTYCDDEGRGKADPRLIKAALYPLDDDVTASTVSAHVEHLERVGVVCRYEAEGRVWLHVVNFDEHQHPNRPQGSKLPACARDLHGVSTHEQRSEPSVDVPPQHTPVVGVVEEGSRSGSRSAERSGETAATLLGEWIDACGNAKPPDRVKGQVAKQVGELLAEGQPYDTVRAGLARWHDRRLNPSALPSVVHEVAQGPPTATARPSNVSAHLALAQSLDAGATR